MCDYTGSHFGASYPDACCINGYLWDLDSGDEDGFTNGGDLPCPACNTAEYLNDAREEAQGTAWGSDMGTLYCGAMIMETAVHRAKLAAPAETEKWISEQEPLATFDWPNRKAVLSGQESAETIIEITMQIS